MSRRPRGTSPPWASAFGVYVLVLILAGCQVAAPPLADTGDPTGGLVSQPPLDPESFVLSLFETRDVVFLGEFHRIAHDVAFVRSLLPRLPEAGVGTLAIEFARFRDQPRIEGLVGQEQWNEREARGILWSFWPWWGYRDYLELYRSAWQARREGIPIRLLGLNARQDWSQVWTPEDWDDPARRRRVFPDGDLDAFMAQTLIDEVLAKGEKALVYTGIHHAFSTYHQPFIDAEGEVVALNERRLGSLIRREIGDRAATVFLHAPWPGPGGYDAPLVLPADGFFDRALADSAPIGFPIGSGPLGRLSPRGGLWHQGHPGFKLAEWCDGWIWRRPLAGYRGVEPLENWFTSTNRLEAIAQLANPHPRVKDRSRSVESLREALARDAAITSRFAHLVSK